MDGRISNFMQIASVRRYTCTDGEERGLRFIDCDNGKIRFVLNESKALDISQLYHRGCNISFISKNGFTPRETHFLSRFEGGMLYTCGLDSVGVREGYEFHGTLHNTPANVTLVRCDESGITVEAEMRASELFGKHLVLKRKIFSPIGSDSIDVTDTLENRGYKSEDYALLYHVNIGYPMLDGCATSEGETESITARTDWANQFVETLHQMEYPEANRFEYCYFLKMKKPYLSMTNKELGKKFTLTWSGETLPCALYWKSMAKGDYAVGFEPSTTFIDDEFKYASIPPQSNVEFRLTLKINDI